MTIKERAGKIHDISCPRRGLNHLITDSCISETSETLKELQSLIGEIKKRCKEECEKCRVPETDSQAEDFNAGIAFSQQAIDRMEVE